MAIAEPEAIHCRFYNVNACIQPSETGYRLQTG